MNGQNGQIAKPTTGKKNKPSLKRISEHTPTREEVAKCLARRKPTGADIAEIQALKLKEKKTRQFPIVFSDTWYEHSVFVSTMGISKKTVNKWLDNGWLAYSQLGKIRIINKADVEEMMLYFRKPAIWERDEPLH